MVKSGIIASVVVVLVWGNLCLADVGSDPTKENAELKARIERLEGELAELKQIVKQQGEAKPKDGGPDFAQRATPDRQKTEVEPNNLKVAAQATGKKPVTSGLDVQIYGRLKLDAAYDTSRTYTGNYAAYVLSENKKKNDNQFDMTANESRLGMWIYGPKDEEVKTSGRVEIDFYGGGTAENKSNPMMRHAYLNLEWPEDKFSILAGQTSDVISPLVEDTLNYTVGWYAGNIGYRRPQIRLTKGYSLSRDVELKLEGAIVRTIGIDNTNFGNGDTGKDAGIPGFQGRVSMTLPLSGYKPTTIGFSGHWAKEEYDTDTYGAHRDFDSWSLNWDLLHPVSEWLTIKSELFTGKNLAAYLGGIGQGINISQWKEIGSTGGWAEASLGNGANGPLTSAPG